MKKKLVVLIIVMLIILPVTVYAYGGIDTNITIGKPDDSTIDVTENIVGTLQVAGTIISVIALIIIGIRYMVSSVDEKAQLKGVLWYYVIGAILVFATSNVLALAYDVIAGL